MISRALIVSVVALFLAATAEISADEPLLPPPVPVPVPVFVVDPVAGGWVGSGVNASNHKGPVNAIFVPTDKNSYRGVFTGRFGIRPYRISCDLAVTARAGDKITLVGKSYIGFGSGQIKFNVVVTPTEMIADFTNPHGGGQLVLSRAGN